MMAATPTKLSSEADVGRSKAQHVVILAFCSKIAGITYSASPNTALDPRLGAKTGLNDEVFVNKLTASVPNGKCPHYTTLIFPGFKALQMASAFSGLFLSKCLRWSKPMRNHDLA